MTAHEYEQFVRGIDRVGLDNEAYNVIGLCGEAGEVAEWYKKMVFRTASATYGKSANLTENDLLKELGDVIHYLTRITLSKGWTLGDIMDANMKKLNKRYGV